MIEIKKEGNLYFGSGISSSTQAILYKIKVQFHFVVPIWLQTNRGGTVVAPQQLSVQVRPIQSLPVCPQGQIKHGHNHMHHKIQIVAVITIKLARAVTCYYYWHWGDWLWQAMERTEVAEVKLEHSSLLVSHRKYKLFQTIMS